MKRRYYLFKSFLVLIAACCTALSAAGQRINAAAECTDDGSGQVVLKAKLTVPMYPRHGDVNCDAQVGIADVSALIDILLNGDDTYFYPADVNGDSSVGIADVSVLIDMLLSGNTDYTMANALTDLNEIYRSMRTAGWSVTGNTHQCFGISAYNLAAEVMGDDLMMGSSGSGWFWYDASYDVKSRYIYSFWRSHDLWNAHYTWIANANYILAAAQSLTGSDANYVKGQAYAIRAYSYFMLAQWFARTYKGHESDPCVPIYNGLMFTGSTGQPRATVSAVYAQIDADIDNALSLLRGTTQQQSVHIGYAVALGLQARIALVKEDWVTAYNSAISAINASGKNIQEVSAFKGLNDVQAGNVMWGADIPTEEVGMYASFWSHMRTDMGYGQYAPKQISKWLYNKMSATDTRRAWWKANESAYGTDAMVQDKFNVVDGTTWDGDYIWMRVEEMYLTAAEAACHRNAATAARNLLTQLMAKRDPNYSCTKTGTDLGALTTEETGSLLEEILIQRRLELWGEDGRIMTIRRLRQGFERTEENGWNVELTGGHTWGDPECYSWVLTIPQSEFVGNPNLDPVMDQNPLGDYSTEGMHISLSEREYTLTTAREYVTIPVEVTRAITKGAYDARLSVTPQDGVSVSMGAASFTDGAATATARLSLQGLQLGRDYTFTVSLSAIDQASYDPSQGEQITSMTITVHCVNGNPSAQHVSFQSGALSYESMSSAMGISVTLTRATTEGEYRTTVALTDATAGVSLNSQTVVFPDGSNTASVDMWFASMEQGKTYSGVLSITDAQGAAGGQYPTLTITVSRPAVESAGTATLTDYTFSSDGGFYCTVPVYNIKGTNEYYLDSPFYELYASYGCADGNWHFTLNSDGSIVPVDGYWGVEFQGYSYLYDSVNYGNACYVEHEGDTHTVHFMVESSGEFYRGDLTIVWNR